MTETADARSDAGRSSAAGRARPSRRRPRPDKPPHPAPRAKDAPRTMRDLRDRPAGQAQGRRRRRTSTRSARASASSACRIRSTLVLFGATGDLAHRKVVPALYQLWRTNLLPHEFVVLAIGRRPYDDDDASARSSATSLEKYSRVLPLDEAAWRVVLVADPLPADATSTTAPRYDELVTTLEAIDKEQNAPRQPPVLPRDPAVGVRRDRRPSSAGSASTTSVTRAAGGGSSSRSRSATTSTRRSA